MTILSFIKVSKTFEYRLRAKKFGSVFWSCIYQKLSWVHELRVVIEVLSPVPMKNRTFLYKTMAVAEIKVPLGQLIKPGGPHRQSDPVQTLLKFKTPHVRHSCKAKGAMEIKLCVSQERET